MGTITKILPHYEKQKFEHLFFSKPDFENPLLSEFVENILAPSLRIWAADDNYEYSLASFIHSFGCSVSFILKLIEKFPVLEFSLNFAVESAKIKILNSVDIPRRADLLINFIDKLFNSGNSSPVPESVIVFEPAYSNKNDSENSNLITQSQKE
ncbi:MAG: hypothetical protein PHN88_12160 [Ignavibacteria bacterium]|nr:hypothetical protein [Ignavibacteria bacterium]